MAEADDITSRVLREAAGVEQWTEVQPTMFEDTFEKEMDKYDKFRIAIADGETTQKELLTQLKVCCLSSIKGNTDIPDLGTKLCINNAKAE